MYGMMRRKILWGLLVLGKCSFPQTFSAGLLQPAHRVLPSLSAGRSSTKMPALDEGPIFVSRVQCPVWSIGH